MTERLQEHFFDSRAAASVAAAQYIVNAVRAQLATQDRTSLIVTGGSSPAHCYGELAASELAWSRVQVLLSDERWVAAMHADSNEKLVRDTLLTGLAGEAQFLSLYAPDVSAAERCRALNAILPGLPLPFACALLGMGDDGHFASLFPDAENLAAGLDIYNPDWCLPITTSASEHLRVSLTLAALLHSESIALLFFGAGKRDVYEQARARSSALPVAKLLSQNRTPVHVFWAA